MEIYNRLKELCEIKGISITSLCLSVTGNKGNLQTWKNNGGHMRSDYLLKCADILGCSTDYILGHSKSITTKTKTISELHTTPHIIAYIDLLGMKETMNSKGNYIPLLSIALNCITEICDSENGIKDTILKNQPEYEEYLNDIKVKVFSDNILFAIEYSPKSDKSLFINTQFLTLIVSSAQKAFFSLASLLSRGGICAGELYFDELFVYGDGLVSAYNLENRIAKYPRVIIDKNLYKDYISASISKFGKTNVFDSDFDGEIFINYFHSHNSKDLQAAQHKISGIYNDPTYAEKPDILQKLNWTRNYIEKCMRTLRYAKTNKAENLKFVANESVSAPPIVIDDEADHT